MNAHACPLPAFARRQRLKEETPLVIEKFEEAKQLLDKAKQDLIAAYNGIGDKTVESAKQTLRIRKKYHKYWGEKQNSYSFFEPFDRGFVLQSVILTVIFAVLNLTAAGVLFYNAIVGSQSTETEPREAVHFVLVSSIFLVQPWLGITCVLLLTRLELFQRGYTKRRIPGFPSPQGDGRNYRGNICAKGCETFADFSWFDPSPLLDKPAGARRIAVLTVGKHAGGSEEGLVHVPILAAEHFGQFAPAPTGGAAVAPGAAARVSFVLPL